VGIYCWRQICAEVFFSSKFGHIYHSFGAVLRCQNWAIQSVQRAQFSRQIDTDFNVDLGVGFVR